MHPAVFAARNPERPACILPDSGEIVTYAELETRSNQGAQLFRKLGLTAGDGIAVYMENNARYLEICWAAQRAGLYYTCVATHLTPAEIAYIVNDCGARVLITSAAKLEIAEQLREQLPQGLTLYMTGATAAGYDSWDATAAAQPDSRIDDETEGHDFLYSSGTTGHPKGVRTPLSGHGLGEDDRYLSRVETIAGDPGPGDLLYSPAPLYHAAPLRFCMTMHRVGGACLLPERFDAELSLALIEQHRCTHSLWVPTMFVRMLKLPEETRARYDVSSLRVAIHGAAPCPVQVKQQMIGWFGPVLLEYYGATEGNGLCCIGAEEWLTHEGSVGRAVLGEVHILDEQERELGPEETGTVYFGEGYEFSYHNDPEKTATAHSRQGWTTLGDIGHVDDDGYLYLTDRHAFTIISGGVNIYPQETENRLILHPSVIDVAVFGIPDPELGEAVKAVVQPADLAAAGPALEAELMSYCRRHLSPIKCPRSIDFEETLPREANGKLYKRLLKSRYWPRHD